MRQQGTWALAAPLATLLLLCTSSASAQSDKAHAKEAYDRGTQASARGDYRKAAEEFARADALAPSPVALQAALDAAVDADDPIIGAELLQRSKRAPAAGALASSIDAATTKLGGRAGHVHVACPASSRCVSTIDGAPLDPTKGAWLKIGAHTLVVQLDGAPDTRIIEIRAGEDFEVVPARGAASGPTPPASTTPLPAAPAPRVVAPPPSTPSAAIRKKPLAPIVFWVAAGATLVVAGVTTGLAISAKGKHDDFVDAGCDKASANACGGLKDDGESVQRLANVGFVFTGVAALTSVIVGAFFTDWGGSNAGYGSTTGRSGLSPMVVPIAGGAALSYGARF